MTEIKITPKGRLYVDDKRVDAPSDIMPMIVLKTIAIYENKDLTFTPYALVKFLTKFVPVNEALWFVATTLSVAKEEDSSITRFAELTDPEYDSADDENYKHAIIPRQIIDAYKAMVSVLDSLGIPRGISIKKIEKRRVSFPYLTWFGFVKCDGRTDYYDREDGEIGILCRKTTVTVYPFSHHPLHFINVLYFLKAYGEGATNNAYAKVADFLPEPTEDLFISKNELEFAMNTEPSHVLGAYYASFFTDAKGKSFMAPIIGDERVDWVQTVVKNMSYDEKWDITLYYKYNEFSGKVVLMPIHNNTKYANAVADFMAMNKNSELIRHVEDKASRLADRLNKLADFLGKVVTTIKLLTA